MSIKEESIDLSPAELKRPMDRSNIGSDSAELNILVGFLNNPAVTGAQVPKGAVTKATSTIPPVTKTEPAPPPVARSIDASKIFYTGRLKSGKDYVATASGAKIFGFSEPLYFLLKYFFGATDKDAHGARKFLQQVGQWGRGVLNEEYPISTARAAFVNMVREHAANGFGGHMVGIEHLKVHWLEFGLNNDIWLNAVVARVEEFLTTTPGARVASTNVRFEHEFSRLKEAGFRHYHVMTTPEEWKARLKKDGLDEKSPVVNDYSEKLAIALDANVIKTYSKQRVGKKLNVIWNSVKPPPSPRLYTVREFLDACGTAAPATPLPEVDGMIE